MFLIHVYNVCYNTNFFKSAPKTGLSLCVMCIFFFFLLFLCSGQIISWIQSWWEINWKSFSRLFVLGVVPPLTYQLIRLNKVCYWFWWGTRGFLQHFFSFLANSYSVSSSNHFPSLPLCGNLSFFLFHSHSSCVTSVLDSFPLALITALTRGHHYRLLQPFISPLDLLKEAWLMLLLH